MADETFIDVAGRQFRIITCPFPRCPATFWTRSEMQEHHLDAHQRPDPPLPDPESRELLPPFQATPPVEQSNGAREGFRLPGD